MLLHLIFFYTLSISLFLSLSLSPLSLSLFPPILSPSFNLFPSPSAPLCFPPALPTFLSLVSKLPSLFGVQCPFHASLPLPPASSPLVPVPSSVRRRCRWRRRTLHLPPLPVPPPPPEALMTLPWELPAPPPVPVPPLPPVPPVPGGGSRPAQRRVVSGRRESSVDGWRR